MIISVKNTKMLIVIPEGYKRVKEKNPIKELQNNKDGIEVYQKVTTGANCNVIINKTDSSLTMPFDDCHGVIDKIHASLEQNQGLITVENGMMERGYNYIYSLIRTTSLEKLSGAIYSLRLNLEFEGEYAEIRADFAECGTFGMRDTMGLSFARNAKLVCATGTDQMAGWRVDPYDASYSQGLPMTLAEREGLDGLFPDHPVSQAREFIHAVLADELMLDATDPDIARQTKNAGTNSAVYNEGNVSAEADRSSELNDMAEMSQEEMYRWMLSKDVKRRFVPIKVEVGPKKDKLKFPSIDLKKVIESGTVSTAEGLAVLKKTAVTAKENVVKTAGIVQEKSKEAQMAVLTFVDKKKNAKFLEAKLASFTDGMRAGKIEAVDYIKKYANFCLASTAISYYFARCDGSIDEAERLEIDYDLDSIIKNKDLPEALRNKLAEISKKEDLTFEDVCVYLDGVGIDTLKEFANDIDEIIMADDTVTPEEKHAKAEFEAYLMKRVEAERK